MGKNIFFSIVCDTDPDINPPFRTFKAKGEENTHIWRGITEGIETLRQHVKRTSFLSKHTALPITWLLRSDRQIYELYGNPAFCFQQFESVWENESTYKSEIGWHPHLYCWCDKTNQWIPYLGFDDDIQMLMECFNSMRQCIDINAVRTGWDYHSNTLMRFFDAQKVAIDASALPCCTQIGVGFYDWRNTPRTPYFPSRFDYRKKGNSPKDALSIIEMPVLVRGLSPSLQIARYALRKLREVKLNTHSNLADWESAKWQGVMITRECKAFIEAVQQTIAAYSEKEDIFLITYFHAADLLLSSMLKRFVLNLANVLRFADSMGFEIVPVTLSTAASLAKEQYRF